MIEVHINFEICYFVIIAFVSVKKQFIHNTGDPGDLRSQRMTGL